MSAFTSSENPRPPKTVEARNAILKGFMCLAAVLILAGLLAPVFAAAGPSSAVDIYAAPGAASMGERFGVANIHLGLYDEATMDVEFEAMQMAGAAWVRCDFAWLGVEPVQGVWYYDAADAIVAKAEAHGIEILGILGSSPPWANGGNEYNYPPTDLAAWREYVSNVVSRYAGRIPAWEIWNEQNIPGFWMPEPDAEAYVELLAAASEEIRAADPSATIVMGGVAGLGSANLNEYLTLGAAEYIDAIAYHPYAETIGVEGQPEEDFLRPKEWLCRELVDFVHGLVALHTEKDLEIWITEVGWTTCDETPPGVDADTQADYLLRTLINYASTDVDRVIWYNFRDTMLNDWDRYGLLDHAFNPRPAYGYYSTFMDVFGPAVATDDTTASFTCSDPSTLEAHCFRLPDGDLAIAAWKADDSADTLNITVDDASLRFPMTVDPLTGTAQPLGGVSRDAQGRVNVAGLAIGKKPVILTLDKVTVSSITPKQVVQHTFAMQITDLAGSGFQPGAAVKLEKDGKIINAYNVNVAAPNKITCTMGFFGVEPGVYDVVVTNPDGSKARLPGAFTVTAFCGMGSGPAVLALGLLLGLISATGTLHRRRSRK
jgi:hypothetical protein